MNYEVQTGSLPVKLEELEGPGRTQIAPDLTQKYLIPK